MYIYTNITENRIALRRQTYQQINRDEEEDEKKISRRHNVTK